MPQFWSSFEGIVNDMGPENKLLLSERNSLQAKIDEWHRQNNVNPVPLAKYRTFLESIGYLLPEPADFKVRMRMLRFTVVLVSMLKRRQHATFDVRKTPKSRKKIVVVARRSM